MHFTNQEQVRTGTPKMSSYFSKAADRYLKAWIFRRTWDTRHPDDMKRFYQFLKSLRRLRHDWSIDFRRKLLKAVKDYHPNLREEYAENKVAVFTEKAQSVYDYVKVGFPVPSVEMKNPYRVANEFHAHKMPDAEIEQILAENFGKNWREQERWR